MNNSIKSDKKLWELYTRSEEYNPARVDSHCRFSSKNSTEKDIFSPEVSKFLIGEGGPVEYQDQKPFAVFLSHDVDMLYPPLKHSLLSIPFSFRRGEVRKIPDFFLWKMKEKEKSPYWNFKKILDLENAYDAHSTFFFLTADRDITHVRYDISDTTGELPTIIDTGGEVGLHGGYFAYNSFDDITKEKKLLENVLGKKIAGYRNHYLRFSIPKTWNLLDKAGFRYDSTLGYPDRIGFRNGMCHPFRPYDLNAKKELDIFEIPLTLMDGTLFDSFPNYGDAWDAAKKIIDVTAELNGIVTLNWHSNTFNCPFKMHWEKMYTKILTYCYRKNAWMTTGENIINWWENKVQTGQEFNKST